MSEENQVEETVPVRKYNAAREEERKLRARVAELEPLAAKVAELEPLAGKLTEYEGKFKAMETEHASALARLGEDLAMAEVGLTDPLGRDTARVVYQRLPEKDRPALGDYLRSLSGEGVEVPKPLQPYFTRAAVADPKAADPKVVPPKPAERPAVMGSDGSSMQARLKAAQAEFARTRDPQVLIDADKQYQEFRRAKGGRP